MRLCRWRQREGKKHQCYEQGRLVFNVCGIIPLAQVLHWMKKKWVGEGWEESTDPQHLSLSASWCGHSGTSCFTVLPPRFLCNHDCILSSQNNSLRHLHTERLHRHIQRDLYTCRLTQTPLPNSFYKAKKSWPPSLTENMGGVIGGESVTGCVGGMLNHFCGRECPLFTSSQVLLGK